MMAAEKKLLFYPPWWFHEDPDMPRLPGEVCYSHSFCKQVDRDMRLLHLQEESQPQAALAAEEAGKEAAGEIVVKEATAEEADAEEAASAMVVEEAVAMEEMVATEEIKKKKMHTEEDEVSDSRKKKIKKEEGKEPKNSPFMEEMEMFDKPLKKVECYPPYSWNIVELLQGGQPHDIPKLLSSETQNKYLIRNDGSRVDIKAQLSGKFVVLYCGWLHDPDLLYHVAIADLKELYKEFQKQLEIVFVALGEGNATFDAIFSEMPWLAIPYEDEEARQQFVRKFSIPRTVATRSVLFSPQGTVLQCEADVHFRLYGVEGFPFSNEKYDEITLKYDELRKVAVQKELSLTELLGANVISMKRGKVPTSDLEGKVVGLHFFDPTTIGQTRKLVELWNSVKEKQHKEFEIVVIFGLFFELPYDEAQFKEEFKHLDWYSLPVDGRYLSHLFNVGYPHDNYTPDVGYFIILEPGRPTLSLGYFAFDIWGSFGSDAYPFTPERAVMIKKEKEQKKVSLDNLLSASTQLRRGRGSKWHEEDTTLGRLLRKNVPLVLLFATHSCYESGSFLPLLKQMYLEKKGTNEYFEIIYISLDCDKSPSSFASCIQEMPWLVHAHVPEYAVALMEDLFDLPVPIPAIAAFGPDWHLVSKESNLAFKTDWNPEYPFISDLGVEVLKDLTKKHRWDLKNIFPGISSTN